MDTSMTPEHPWYVPQNERARVGERYLIADSERAEPRVIEIEAADDDKIYWQDDRRREGAWLHVAIRNRLPLWTRLNQ